MLPKMMTDKVTIDLNVLGALMKNIIMSKVNSTTVVTVKMSVDGLRSTHVSQELTKSEEFRGSIGKSMVLSFSTRASNNKLFLVTPKDKRGTQQEAITSGRATVSGISSLVYINIGAQLKRRLGREVKAMEKRTLDVSKDIQNISIMSGTRSNHELTTR